MAVNGKALQPSPASSAAALLSRCALLAPVVAAAAGAGAAPATLLMGVGQNAANLNYNRPDAVPAVSQLISDRFVSNFSTPSRRTFGLGAEFGVEKHSHSGPDTLESSRLHTRSGSFSSLSRPGTVRSAGGMEQLLKQLSMDREASSYSDVDPVPPAAAESSRRVGAGSDLGYAGSSSLHSSIHSRAFSMHSSASDNSPKHSAGAAGSIDSWADPLVSEEDWHSLVRSKSDRARQQAEARDRVVRQFSFFNATFVHDSDAPTDHSAAGASVLIWYSYSHSLYLLANLTVPLLRFWQSHSYSGVSFTVTSLIFDAFNSIWNIFAISLKPHHDTVLQLANFPSLRIQESEKVFMLAKTLL